MGQNSARAPRLLIVIPAFNEAGVIRDVVRRVLETPLPLPPTVLVVDDGSGDGTAREARLAGARVVSLVANLGYGSALKTGYLLALAEGYDLVLQMDGHGQHDPSSIAALIEPVLADRADLVVGSRNLGGGTYPMPFARKMGQRLFGALLNAMSGLRVEDPTSGFQAIGPRVMRLLATDEFPGDYPDTDMLLYLSLHGCRIQEVPATFHVNAAGTSMHSGVLKPAYYVYKMLFSMVLVASRHRRLRARVARESVRVNS